MPSKSNDPRWITARFVSECWADGCERAIRKNEDIFYFPIGKAVYGSRCLHAQEVAARWESKKADDEAVSVA